MTRQTRGISVKKPEIGDLGSSLGGALGVNRGIGVSATPQCILSRSCLARDFNARTPTNPSGGRIGTTGVLASIRFRFFCLIRLPLVGGTIQVEGLARQGEAGQHQQGTASKQTVDHSHSQLTESAQQSTRKPNSNCSDVFPTRKGNQQHGFSGGVLRRGISVLSVGFQVHT